MGNQTVLTPGQMKDLAATLVQAIPSDLSEEVAQYIIENKSLFQNILREAILGIKLPRWREENGVIYFKVTSDGTTGPQWVERLERGGFRVSKWAKQVLNSPDFKPTSGVTYRIAVLKGSLFADSERIDSQIWAEAERRKLVGPHPEVACLIRELLSDKELEQMGLWWIVVFHEPIKDSDGDPILLNACRGNEGRFLDANYDRPDDNWNSDNGFAFAVPQLTSFFSLIS